MNSPYKCKFRVSQEFKGSAHDGLDLVGVDSKEIHSTIAGIVERAGWENAENHSQGFGQYVRIKKDGSDDRYYFGHLSKINVKVGQKVLKGDIIGIEGNTGHSFGSHCHYCVRTSCDKKKIKDISVISGIPNKIGTYQVLVHKTVSIYFDKYTGKSVSIADALKSLNITSTFNYRSKIAKANGIKAYIGTASQNTKMLNLLKQGKLLKP